jgi:hypothetical protein
MAAFVVAHAAASGSSYAQEPSGIAVAVIQAADVGRGGGQLILKPDSPVFMGDVIKTDGIGDAQIRLSDNTRLVVGPNSLIVIDRFVFDTSMTAKQVSLTVARGAFRFITGGSRKEAYTISTPTATIGVRGTEFDVSVNGEGTGLAVFHGQANLCERSSQRNRCTLVTSGCSVAVAGPATPIRRIETQSERRRIIENRFPLIIDQQRLNAAFQVDTSDCGLSRLTPIRRAEGSDPNPTASIAGLATSPPVPPPPIEPPPGTPSGNPCGGNCGNAPGGNGTGNEGQGKGPT